MFLILPGTCISAFNLAIKKCSRTGPQGHVCASTGCGTCPRSLLGLLFFPGLDWLYRPSSSQAKAQTPTHSHPSTTTVPLRSTSGARRPSRPTPAADRRQLRVPLTKILIFTLGPHSHNSLPIPHKDTILHLACHGVCEPHGLRRFNDY